MLIRNKKKYRTVADDYWIHKGQSTKISISAMCRWYNIYSRLTTQDKEADRYMEEWSRKTANGN